MSNKKKAEFLGMPYGTACGRLRKRIMFSLIQEIGADICYRCGDPIESYEELTIEHKKPWLDVSVDLFWDINNIAFSHTECNRPHRHGDGYKKRRKIGPDGTSWCYICKCFKDKSLFYQDKTRWCGTRSACKECEKERIKAKRKRPFRQKRCLDCGATPDEALFCPGRNLCKDCYNKRQRIVMRKRRELKKIDMGL